MKCEIINPSDPYSIEIPDALVGFAAMALLSNCKYALEDEEGEAVVPIFFGSHEEWWAERSEVGFEDWIEANIDRVATALESVTIRGERSSMNDIGARAASLAKRIRERASAGE